MATDLQKRGHALEEAFFTKRDEELLAKLRDHERAKRKQGELADMTGIRDAKVLAALVAIGVSPDSLLAFALAPIIVMAWRKGKIEPAERNAILRAAEGHGVSQGEPGWELIESWLQHRPSSELRPSWDAYAAALRETLPPADFKRLREEIVGRARDVARAAGGFLGIGAVSADEKQFIEELEKVLK